MNSKDLQDIYQNLMEIETQREFKMPLLAIGEPIFGIISYLDKFYTIYVMQDRTLLRDNHLIDVKELLITEPSIDDLYKMIDGEISIYNFFSNSNKYRIGKIADKIFPYTEVSRMSEISQKIPSVELFLHLNDFCKNDYKLSISSRLNRLKHYENFNTSLTFRNINNVELKRHTRDIDINWKVENEIYCN